MRILRNLILIIFPIALMVSLYAFIINGSEAEYRGMAYLYDHFSTFPGLNLTFDTIESIQNSALELVDFVYKGAGLDVVGSLFKMIGYVFFIPISIIISVIQDLYWVLTMLFFA